MSERLCSFEGCGRPHHSRGYCAAHAQQRRRGQELRPPKVPREGCSFEGCGRPHKALGLCIGHRSQQLRGQELRPIKARPQCQCGEQDPSRLMHKDGRPVSRCLACNREAVQAWRTANPDAWRAQKRRRRARTAGVPSEPYSREQVFARTGGGCWICGRWLASPAPGRMHVDHLRPIAKGGADALANLAPACPACNIGRSTGRSIDWHLAAWDAAR